MECLGCRPSKRVDLKSETMAHPLLDVRGCIDKCLGRGNDRNVAAIGCRQITIRTFTRPAVNHRSFIAVVDSNTRSFAMWATRDDRSTASNAGEIGAVYILLQPHYSAIAFRTLVL